MFLWGTQFPLRMQRLERHAEMLSRVGGFDYVVHQPAACRNVRIRIFNNILTLVPARG